MYNNSALQNVVDVCTIKAIIIESNKPTSFKIDTFEKPNQKFLVGKKVGDTFKLHDFAPLYKAQDLTYKIVKILSPQNSDLKIEKVDQEDVDVVKFLKGRGIKHLIHFTRIENIESILKYGICSLERCNEMGIIPFVTDSQRLDALRGFSCFSVGYQNYKMMYSKKMYGYKFAILLIDIGVLNDCSKETVVFSCCNAASKGLHNAKGLIGAKSLFQNEKIRIKNSLPQQYTTDPQAEILIENVVKPEYIEKIFVQTNADFQKLKHINRVVVDEQRFSPRYDWRYWQKTKEEKENGNSADFYY